MTLSEPSLGGDGKKKQERTAPIDGKVVALGHPLHGCGSRVLASCRGGGKLLIMTAS